MYRNVLFRAIIDRMQWGWAGKENRETAPAALGIGHGFSFRDTSPYPPWQWKSRRGAVDVNTAF